MERSSGKLRRLALAANRISRAVTIVAVFTVFAIFAIFAGFAVDAEDTESAVTLLEDRGRRSAGGAASMVESKNRREVGQIADRQESARWMAWDGSHSRHHNGVAGDADRRGSRRRKASVDAAKDSMMLQLQTNRLYGQLLISPTAPPLDHSPSPPPQRVKRKQLLITSR
ncbi:hypothetical protein R3P38DRAFT_2777153 [Favolaschia claudopus]|uniref:Transmembrane protein n=1 Tax=Favolaschia claudopus TaxID=2862362 RepID=A0AAW0BKI5_9AGAR